MPKFTFTLDPGKLAQNTVKPHVVRHGPPRWGRKAQGGKGGQEIRPPYIVAGTRKPDVSLDQTSYARAKRRTLLNLVADAAVRHGMPIPDAPTYVPMTVEQHKAELRKQLALQDQREEAKAAEQAAKLEIQQKAKMPSGVAHCGRCGKLIAALLPADEYRQQTEDCPRRAEIFREFLGKTQRAQNQWKRRFILGAPQDDKEAALTKSDLQDEFNASDIAIAASKEQRVRYVKAEDYSEDH